MQKFKFLIFISLFLSASSYAQVGLRFSPIAALVGYADASIDIGLGSLLRVTPTINYWNLTLENSDDQEFNIKLQGYGADLTIHPSGTFSDGFYFGAYTTQAEFEYTNEIDNEIGTASLSSSGGVLGYQWCWPSFYMNLAFKVGQNTGDDEILVKNADTEVETGETEDLPSTVGGTEFKIGWFY